MSDYRDDRGALRSRNAELEQQLADRERELAELRSQNVAAKDLPAPVLPVKRDVDPRVLMEMRGAEVRPISKRLYLIGGLGLLIALLVGAMYSDRARALVQPGSLLLAVLVTFALLLLAVGWPKKE